MIKKKYEPLFNTANKLLTSVAYSYNTIKNIARKTKKSIPYIYTKMESLVKSHLITLDKDHDLIHNGNLDTMTKIITKSLLRKLPTLEKEKISRIVEDKSSLSFLDMLTRGLGVAEKEKDYSILPKEKLFKNVLIANRGEIALRIIRACKELGIKTTVVYSNDDRNTLSVRFADKSYSIGSSKSYLDFKKIIDIAKKAKADAIHPGYGFLAENPYFAEECEKNKIKFIGPSSRAIHLMGDKIKARQTARKSHVPLIQGTSEIKNLNAAVAHSKNMGYPLIIKAKSGGGGKGMRIVNNEGELRSSFEGAQLEAENAFNDGTLYLEKYAKEAKHIEFQILGDRSGNVIHLGERDCSIQRRHQKLIEEAPSTAIDQDLREQMGKAAVNVVKAAKYEGAGTVEFLLDKNKRFYFMEMNARIQVEHGITEMITNVDLVKEQIKLAAGAKLAYKQEDIKFEGWAIECRINAECPSNDFCPQTGTIINYLPPGGPGIRVSSSCHAGHVVSPLYDSLISKVMCKGKNRHEAIVIMRRALDEYIIDGVETTIPFHKAVLRNKLFIKGNITTGYIDKSGILETIKKEKKSKIKLSKKDKILIVTTAVSKYMGQKQSSNNKPSQWATAGRQDAMNNENV